MSFLQKWGLIVLTVLALMAAAGGSSWFAASAKYSKQYEALKAGYEQASKDQAIEDAKTLTRYAAAALEVQNEARNQIGGMSVDIADLSMRVQSGHQALGICAANPVPGGSVPIANGSGTNGSAPAATGSTRSTGQTIAIDPEVLRDDLKIGIKAVDAELLYRQLLRP